MERTADGPHGSAKAQAGEPCPKGDGQPPEGSERAGGSGTAQAPARRKSMAATLLLAGLLGFGGMCGIGHIYVGRTRRGIVVLAASFAIAGLGAAALVAALPESPDPTSTLADLVAPLLALLALPAAYFGFVIWTVIDAGRACRAHNAALDGAGAPP